MAFVSCTSSQFIFIFLLKRLFWLAHIFYCNILYICCSLQNKHPSLFYPYSFFASWSLQFRENIHIKLLVECVRIYYSSYKGGAVADCVDSYPISVIYQIMEPWAHQIYDLRRVIQLPHFSSENEEYTNKYLRIM